MRTRWRRRSGNNLRHKVEEVVALGNCTGCGGCAALSDSISMQLDAEGFLRPQWEEDPVRPMESADDFVSICPGVQVQSSPRNGQGDAFDPVVGRYVSVWRGWATDPVVRWRGSSGGVLTALSMFLVDEGLASAVVGAGMSRSDPTRTVSLRLQSRDEIQASAGSRYAPVANTELVGADFGATAFVGKPCEVYAARRLAAVRGVASPPILLSFFCAGTPSQHATNAVIESLGVDPLTAKAVAYRGRGWPGNFTVENRGEQTFEATYQESWGSHLGPTVQDRCKICPDGTGEEADIAVGDLWHSDDLGYPEFVDAEGQSVVIARTLRGHQLLLEASAKGAIELQSIEVEQVGAMQPLQRKRRLELPGRLLGRRLAGRRVPRYRGYRLLRIFAAYPKQNLKAARGSYGRVRRAMTRVE